MIYPSLADTLPSISNWTESSVGVKATVKASLHRFNVSLRRDITGESAGDQGRRTSGSSTIGSRIFPPDDVNTVSPSSVTENESDNLEPFNALTVCISIFDGIPNLCRGASTVSPVRHMNTSFWLPEKN